MGLKLILVCKEGPAKQAYLREATSIGIEVDGVATFGDLFKAMITTAYQGIMVDMVTSLKASREEKGIAQEILDVFPLIQLRWDAENNSIQTISTAAGLSGNTLAHFVAQECQIFTPRAIRISVRKPVHFNVLMCRHEDMAQSLLERSITVNISKGGCFLFSCQDWSNASEVWFEIKELKDKTPILGTIRWRQPWGKTMAMPGFGVSITQMTSRQKAQLVDQYSLPL